jgi:hypothetical protein
MGCKLQHKLPRMTHGLYLNNWLHSNHNFSYAMAISSAPDRTFLKKMDFHYAIYDEAHMLKNMKALRYQQLLRIKVLHYHVYLHTFCTACCNLGRHFSRHYKYPWRPIYTTQLLPKTVACNLLAIGVVLCKSSTQLTCDNVSKLCVWFTQYNSNCKQVACDSFRQPLCSVNRP